MLPSKCENTCEKGTIFDNRGQISADSLGWIWRGTVFDCDDAITRGVGFGSAIKGLDETSDSLIVLHD